MTAAERARLVDEYSNGYDAVASAIGGISDEELDHSAEDGWTPRQIVHHVADAELIAAARMRYLLAHPAPAIQGFDEKVFAGRLPYDRPIEPSLELLRGAVATTSALLERMSDDDWSRAAVHSERGRYTPEDWLRTHSSHARDHAAQIRRARGRE